MRPFNRNAAVTIFAFLLFSLIFVASQAKEYKTPKGSPLAIEIALQKPFYVPAAGDGRITTVVVRVPADYASMEFNAISAVRLEPKMVGDKVRVDVFALRGEPSDVRTCRDWDNLKAVPVDSYLLGVDEEVALTKLKTLGVKMGTEPLSFRVVPKRVLSPRPDYGVLAGDCECGSCGSLICCANEGHCLGCGSCGYVCCRSE